MAAVPGEHARAFHVTAGDYAADEPRCWVNVAAPDHLSQVDAAQITRKHGISAATYYHWKSKYGGAAVSELKRLRELEAENAKLKRMYADLALENTAIKDVLSRKL